MEGRFNRSRVRITPKRPKLALASFEVEVKFISKGNHPKMSEEKEKDKQLEFDYSGGVAPNEGDPVPPVPPKPK